MSTLDLVREQVRKIGPYTLAERGARIKLDQNESPFDLPLELKKLAISRILDRPWNRYPQFEQSRIRAAFAERNDLSPEEVLVGNGSNELLVAVMQTFVDARSTVVVARPSFSLYEHYARILDANIVGVPVDLRSGVLPVEGIVDAANSSPGRVVVLLCSPNNPTGSILAEGDLQRILATGAVVVLDRAYGEFVAQGLPRPTDRLIALSTLSKAYGLAGLRIGWLVSTAETVGEIRKVKLPYNLNLASEEIALVAIEERDKLLSIIDTIVAERDRVASEMRELGVEVFPSAANFILFRVGHASSLFHGLLERDILVRDVSSGPGLDNCLRVSIGTRRENDEFLNALRALRPAGIGVMEASA